MIDEQIPPATDKKMQEAFTQFQEKWDKMDTNERNGTLLNMVLSLSYRLDILASVVSNLSEVQEMDNAAQEAVEKVTKTKEKENGEQSSK